MRRQVIVLAAALHIAAPLGAKAADLVVWWEKGFTVEEDEAVAEIIGAFEQDTGKQVEVVFYPQAELPGEIEAALEAGKPPDFAFGLDASSYVAQWAFDDRLVDLSDAIGFFANMFDTEALASVVLVNGKLGHEALYALPMGRPRPSSTSGRASWSKRASPSRTFRRSGGILVVLVRPGAAGVAPRYGPRRRFGCRPAHVG
jgi:ABC-type glycerol-3-phosphate transport system substrate-binding protein